MAVFGAQATELERDFPFGVAIQLFEPMWMAADPDAKAHLLAGRARRAGELLEGALPESDSGSGDQAYAVIHSLFRLLSNLVARREGEREPLAMLVDDAHWADRPSLRFLAYAAERLTTLPVVLIATIRSGEPAADPAALLALRRSAVSRRAPPRCPQPRRRGRDRPRPVSRTPTPRSAAPARGSPTATRSCSPSCSTRSRPMAARPTPSPRPAWPTVRPSRCSTTWSAGSAPCPPTRHWSPAQSPCSATVRTWPRWPSSPALTADRVHHAADALAAGSFFHPGFPLSFVHPLIASAVSPLRCRRSIAGRPTAPPLGSWPTTAPRPSRSPSTCSSAPDSRTPARSRSSAPPRAPRSAAEPPTALCACSSGRWPRIPLARCLPGDSGRARPG